MVNVLNVFLIMSPTLLLIAGAFVCPEWTAQFLVAACLFGLPTLALVATFIEFSDRK